MIQWNVSRMLVCAVGTVRYKCELWREETTDAVFISKMSWYGVRDGGMLYQLVHTLYKQDDRIRGA